MCRCGQTLVWKENLRGKRKEIIDTGDDMFSASLATGLFDAGSAFVNGKVYLRDLKSIIDA